MPWTRVSWTGRGVTTVRPAPPCGGRPGWGPGPMRPTAPHPNPPPQAGAGGGVGGGPWGDDCAPLPPLAGEGRDGAGSAATHCPHPHPPRKRGRERVSRPGQASAVPTCPRPKPPRKRGGERVSRAGRGGDNCAPLPPLAGEGRDGGRLRGDPLPPTPTLPRKRGVPQQLVPCRRRTSVLRPRPASPCTPGHGRPGATDVQPAPLRRRRLRLTPPVPVPAHAPAPSRRPRPPAHRTTP